MLLEIAAQSVLSLAWRTLFVIPDAAAPISLTRWVIGPRLMVPDNAAMQPWREYMSSCLEILFVKATDSVLICASVLIGAGSGSGVGEKAV